MATATAPSAASAASASSGAGAADGMAGLVEEYGVRLLGPRNARNIPTMKFIDDIEAFVTEEGVECERLLQALTMMHSKYKMMESAMVSNRQRMQAKQPEIARSLAAVRRLKKARADSETLDTTFSLSDNVLARADVPPTESVYLWLGVGVMVEYSLDEAEETLQTNLTEVKAKEKVYDEDLRLVREQAITTEVNLSRTFNFDVQQRRKSKPGEAEA